MHEDRLSQNGGVASAPGGSVGPYDLLTLVGSGGMAQVWAARARETGHIVALKLLLPELAENESFRQMFYDEACIASLAAHPNVCRIHHLSQDQGTLYLAMDWVDGTSLMRLVRPNGDDESDAPALPLPPRIAARIVADACAGLHAAHELRGENGQLLEVVHRDASPHNVLVGRDGAVKMTDFGVAKALGKLNVTIAGQIKGKLAYMSPEQLMGGDLDRRTDVFALGAVLYEVTTGRRPFVGEHDPQVMAAIAMGEYPAPTSFVAGYPPELQAVVDRALANEPKDRYATAAELARALEAFLARTGPPVRREEIAAVVHARCGAEVEGRARGLEDAIRRIERARADATGAMAPVGARDGGQGMFWLFAAALLGIGLGLGLLAYLKGPRRPPTATAAKTSTTTAPNPTTSPVAPGASVTTVAVFDPAPAATPAAEVESTLELDVAPAPTVDAPKPRPKPAPAPAASGGDLAAVPREAPPNPYD